jgi:CRP/FNR family transcriptional regulator
MNNKGKRNCTLTECILCKNTLPEWKPAIEANRKNFNFQKNDIIFTEGSEVKGMYFVTKGVVKVHKQWGPDKELIIRFATSGDIFGHRGMGADLIYPVSATALNDAQVCYIPMDFFMSTLKVNPQFQFYMLQFFAEELRISEKKMRDMVHMSVQGRVATTLLRCETKFEVDKNGMIIFTPARQDLAAYSGTTYETLFRTLTAFEKDGLIKTAGKSIGILNHEQLKIYAEEMQKI